MYEFLEIDNLTYRTQRLFDGIIFDSPYGKGMKYLGDFKDSLAYFHGNIEPWVNASVEKLAEHGSIFGYITGEAHYLLYDLFKKAGLEWRQTLQWYYTFGQHTKHNFTSFTTPILYMVKKRGKHIWNGDAVKVPSDRERYGDKRANPTGKTPPNIIVTLGDHVLNRIDLHDPGVFLETLWSYPRVMGNFTEREPDSPNQLPIEMLMRQIAATTPVGGWLYDPFVGTGSTIIACNILHRNCVGCDPFTANMAVKHIEKYQRLFCERAGLVYEEPREWFPEDGELVFKKDKWVYTVETEEQVVCCAPQATPTERRVPQSSSAADVKQGMVW